jgi:3',5'-cyclic-AMP phosphodiesterase
MSKPFVLVQISDTHLGGTWFSGDPGALLATVVEAVRAAEPRPDAVLVSGDLADHATDREYELVRELLASFNAPIYVLPGNHDDRRALRHHFGLPGVDDDPVQYAVDLGPMRLVVLDSTRPGDDGGELDTDRLAWLDATLAADRATPTVLAMHHPPVPTGVPAWDRILIPRSDRLALGRIVESHPQLRRIVAGHLHKSVIGELNGRGVLVVPSTCVQLQLAFGATELQLSRESPGYAVHALLDGYLVSYIQSLS